MGSLSKRPPGAAELALLVEPVEKPTDNKISLCFATATRPHSERAMAISRNWPQRTVIARWGRRLFQRRVIPGLPDAFSRMAESPRQRISGAIVTAPPRSRSASALRLAFRKGFGAGANRVLAENQAVTIWDAEPTTNSVSSDAMNSTAAVPGSKTSISPCGTVWVSDGRLRAYSTKSWRDGAPGAVFQVPPPFGTLKSRVYRIIGAFADAAEIGPTPADRNRQRRCSNPEVTCFINNLGLVTIRRGWRRGISQGEGGRRYAAT